MDPVDSKDRADLVGPVDRVAVVVPMDPAIDAVRRRSTGAVVRRRMAACRACLVRLDADR